MIQYKHPLFLPVQADYTEQGDDAWGNGRILLLPTIIVNKHQYRGRLDVPSVMRALCAGFSETTEPEARFGKGPDFKEMRDPKCIMHHAPCIPQPMSNSDVMAAACCRNTGSPGPDSSGSMRLRMSLCAPVISATALKRLQDGLAKSAAPTSHAIDLLCCMEACI
jgi:hypothetical protein